MTLVLGSRSPARLATLRAAGVEPAVRVSHVDEDRVLADARAAAAPSALAPVDAVLGLARAKAETVLAALAAAPLTPDERTSLSPTGPQGTGTPVDVVVGCDSMLELDGDVLGKPTDAEDARERWLAMRGRTGTLHSGHCVLTTDGRSSAATSSTRVTFADVGDDEIDAYVATGEPLEVAGAFTVDGLGGAFVESIEGDHHGVVGISLPLLRRLLAEIDVPWVGLWSRG
ncbi:Maf-like protein [Paraoerskovia sediminicola]|uniref:Nucleoside triphosphate pyrophosphatase n=1 Tax=Paraoerskovia sediminicola TaxID=1138587 RepID=A0ABM8FYZ3_9CELL|nr:Maf family protein [Paraoerskovia sediminicola]BDZ40896.1 Maf-like protein [Paraoerskovia sediminicola]